MNHETIKNKETSQGRVDRVVSRLIAFAFSPCLKAHGFEVVKVKGWGCFLVEGKGIMRKTVWFKWYQGLI